MAHADTRADFMVYGSDKTLQLAVEVRTKRDASLEWVSRLRRNLLVRGFIPPSPYFLLALPDFFYLWMQKLAMPWEIAPDYKIYASKALSLYSLGWTTDPTSYTTHYAFELVINLWLENLVDADLAPDKLTANTPWLVDSGLYKAIKGGSVVAEAKV